MQMGMRESELMLTIFVSCVWCGVIWCVMRENVVVDVCVWQWRGRGRNDEGLWAGGSVAAAL